MSVLGNSAEAAKCKKPQPDLDVIMYTDEVIGAGGSMQGIKTC